MKKQLRHAVTTGIIFGIITIFLFLIGFITTGADLLGGILGNKNGDPFLGLTIQTWNMILFVMLVGLFAGAAGARKEKNQEEDPWAAALLGGLVAGLVHGLMVALLAIMVGTLNENGVRISRYLSSVLPADVKLFLAGNTPIVGAILHFVLLTLAVLLGGVIARGIGRGSWRTRWACHPE